MYSRALRPWIHFNLLGDDGCFGDGLLIILYILYRGMSPVWRRRPDGDDTVGSSLTNRMLHSIFYGGTLQCVSVGAASLYGRHTPLDIYFKLSLSWEQFLILICVSVSVGVGVGNLLFPYFILYFIFNYLCIHVCIYPCPHPYVHTHLSFWLHPL